MVAKTLKKSIYVDGIYFLDPKNPGVGDHKFDFIQYDSQHKFIMEGLDSTGDLAQTYKR
jgi:hypothetical protein